MDYLTVRETAETWNLSLRTVQQLCAQGRIPGAKKFGKFWAIPAGAAKPQVSQQDQLLAEGPSAPGGQLDAANLMPLMNTPFLPGRCRAAVEAMAPGPRRDIALAEYHYFTGHPEEAAQMLIEGDTTGSLSASEELIVESQKWMADQYKAEVEQWGYIDPARWNAFYNWLNENDLVAMDIPENTGFSNDYLPE